MGGATETVELVGGPLDGVREVLLRGTISTLFRVDGPRGGADLAVYTRVPGDAAPARFAYRENREGGPLAVDERGHIIPPGDTGGAD